MTEARPVLPTDLLALVSYNGRGYRNQAWTRERLGADETQNTLGMVLDQCLAFARGRSAWISVRRQRLQGLVGARRRGGRQAWEIDYLIDATRDQEAVGGLLDCAIAEVGRAGAEKLFLRLTSDSDLFEVVREAGFVPYREEVLYTRGPGIRNQAPAVEVRPVMPSDSYSLFRLYNVCTPEVTRRQEAATFGEWHAAQERRWLKHGAELVQERNGRVAASARAARLGQGVAVDLLLDASELDEAPALIEAALQAVEPEAGARVFVLLPAQAEGLARRLEDEGFGARQQFVSLMRRTTRPQSLPKLLPAIAETVRA